MRVRTIPWLNQFDFENALRLSRERNKPVLLDFHHRTCVGCRQLETETYSSREVIEAIEENVTPVRIIATEWDRLTTEIINCYISISTPTIQLLFSDGTVSHYWHAAPRQTVLSGRQISHSTRRVYVEASGYLSPKLFLAELFVGLGKVALKAGQLWNAMQFFERMKAECDAGSPAVIEANYWQTVASAKISASL